MKPINIKLPEDLHKTIKLESVKQEIPMKDLIIRELERSFKK